MSGLPPGEYFAVAAPSIDESERGRRERLAALKTLGTPFRIDPDTGHASLTLQVSATAAAVR